MLRKLCSVVDVIMMVGGCDNLVILSSVCCYIFVVDKWMDLL